MCVRGYPYVRIRGYWDVFACLCIDVVVHVITWVNGGGQYVMNQCLTSPRGCKYTLRVLPCRNRAFATLAISCRRGRRCRGPGVCVIFVLGRVLCVRVWLVCLCECGHAV